MKQYAALAALIALVVSVDIADSSAPYRVYIPQVLSDAPRLVYALGPCGAPLECVQSPTIGYP